MIVRQPDDRPVGLALLLDDRDKQLTLAADRRREDGKFQRLSFDVNLHPGAIERELAGERIPEGFEVGLHFSGSPN
ncbi:hypothetical protein [Bradyrhizobium aeschynomenes]|uniref:hypothetical protein n=1 Tax=Bradyrhizobium aeschynomenes TaxID=2734909 RepID=UPI001552D2FF|nr:hypothetical protein [Bradyrhizobium aeschynomenes]NPV19288.1 hypothetical protein [Bradyrhizobium aeschynomenes]